MSAVQSLTQQTFAQSLNKNQFKNQCQLCRANFTAFEKKLNCYFCYKVMCKRCSLRRPTPNGSQRICIDCREQLISQKIPESLKEQYKEVVKRKELMQEEITNLKQKVQSNNKESDLLRLQAKQAKFLNYAQNVSEIDNENDQEEQQKMLLKQKEFISSALQDINEQNEKVVTKISQLLSKNQDIELINAELKQEIEKVNKKMEKQIRQSTRIQQDLDNQKKRMSRRTSSLYSCFQNQEIMNDLKKSDLGFKESEDNAFENATTEVTEFKSSRSSKMIKQNINGACCEKRCSIFQIQNIYFNFLFQAYFLIQIKALEVIHYNRIKHNFNYFYINSSIFIFQKDIKLKAQSRQNFNIIKTIQNDEAYIPS